MNYEVAIRISIKLYLEENGIKLNWLAEKLGMNRVLLSNKLRGKAPLKFDDIANIEKALNYKFIKVN